VFAEATNDQCGLPYLTLVERVIRIAVDVSQLAITQVHRDATPTGAHAKGIPYSANNPVSALRMNSNEFIS